MAKTAMTQRQLKHLYGLELADYAEANGIIAPLEEKNRCWRLVYADEVDFHLDTVPSIPESAEVIALLIARGVPVELASRAIAITDKRHRDYDRISPALLSSNPRGFAKWFEACARQSAELRLRRLVESRLYASVEDVPPYEWKTPLQRSIQFMKRHRDVMFRDKPGLAPISMIITNLAAQAYSGEGELGAALINIVDRLPTFVRSVAPRVPNPADPAEDYADRWSRNPALEQAFFLWHAQLKADLGRLMGAIGKGTVVSILRDALQITLTGVDAKRFDASISATGPAIVTAPAVTRIPSGPRPWGKH